jgi:hypothetical protein
LILINTPNTNDPITSADSVSFSSGGFTSAFNVLEQQSASAELFAKFVTGTITPSTAPEGGKSLDVPLTFANTPGLSLQILGFGNASQFGFVSGDNFSGGGTPQAIPEPMTALGTFTAIGLGVVLKRTRNRMKI